MVRRLMPVVLAVAVGAWSSSAAAQRFSNPETPPASPAPAEPAKQDDPSNHRVAGGGKFTLPLDLYDEQADAAKDIAAAAERARLDNRRVLAMWGENRCEFCAYLNELITTDPQLRRLIESEYVLVKVDIGKFDKNIDLATQYNTPITQTKPTSFGAPAFTVIDPVRNQAVEAIGGNAMVAKNMSLTRVFDEGVIFDFLDRNKAQAKVASVLLLEARQKARREGKRVLAYFHVYGSEGGAAFDRAVTGPGLAPIIDKAYVARKIDVERTIGGHDLLRKLKGSPTATPPWAIVLDGSGNAVEEAGRGLEFDPAEAAAAAEWLVAASGGKLSAADAQALTAGLSPAEPAKTGEPK